MNRSMLIFSLLNFYEVCRNKTCDENYFIDLKNSELNKIAKKIIKENSKTKLNCLEKKAIDFLEINLKRNKKHQKHKAIFKSK